LRSSADSEVKSHDWFSSPNPTRYHKYTKRAPDSHRATMVSHSWLSPPNSTTILRLHTKRKPWNQGATIAHPHTPKQQAQKPDPDKVSRVARKSPVDGLDMQRFFGASSRPKPTIDLPQRSRKEGPAVKPRSTVASDDLGLPHELVEAILSHLPIFDLIGATGINMTFRNIVQNSPMLQRKLFLRPTQEPTRYVQMEHPDYGCRIIVAGEGGVDEHDNGEDSSDEHNGGDHDGEADAGDDPEQKSEWQWSYGMPVVDLCPLLLHKYHGHHKRSARHRFFYEGGEKVHFSDLAPLAEHRANMYLTNPPTTDVIVRMVYSDGDYRHVNIYADRTVYCESGVTIASLLDVPNMEGDVEVAIDDEEQWDGWVANRLLGLRNDTTLSRDMEELAEHSGGSMGCRPGKAELNTVETVIEFPGLVFREWRAKSDECYVRLDERIRSYRESQVTAEEEVLHG
jgi:hypothetical protein